MSVKLSRRDERMVSKRARCEPLCEPCYDMEVVPSVRDATVLADSCLVRQTDRDQWKSQLTELLLLCNEAAWRSAQRQTARNRGRPPPAAPYEAKPLVLEYILDRLDTDDPLCGYQLRTRAEGWLQGFITFTAFTTWQTYFRWDSLDPRAGITLDDLDAHRVDEDGELSAELDECARFGDPDGCGVIWPRVAEITLLGGLGCGAQLLQLALDDLARQGSYDYVVLQATDNAIPFYERHGFVRVGAVAAHHTDPEHALTKSNGADPPVLKRKRGAEAKRESALSEAQARTLAKEAAANLGAPDAAAWAELVSRAATDEQRARAAGVRLWWANRAIHGFVKALRRRPCAPHFCEPVADILLYYREIVAEPMDLSTMAAGACAGLYCGRLAAALADVRRIEAAAFAYNGKRRAKEEVPREVCQAATRLSKEGRVLARAWREAHPAYLFADDDLDDADGAKALPSARERERAPRSFAEAVGTARAAAEARSAAAAAAGPDAVGKGAAPHPPQPPLAPPPAAAASELARRGPRVAARDTAYQAAASGDAGVLGYSHWTFADQPTLDQFPSYMMARRLSACAPGGELPPVATEDPGAAAAQANSARPSALRRLLALRPRGVVPRGVKFVAKLVAPSGGSPEYFGPCDSEREVEELYAHAAHALRERERAVAAAAEGAAERAGAGQHARPQPGALGGRARLAEHLEALLVEAAPPPVPRRAPTAGAPGAGVHEGAPACVERASPPDGGSCGGAGCAAGEAVRACGTESSSGSAAGGSLAPHPAPPQPCVRMPSQRLYNAVVTISDLPQAYAQHRYWFVMQFVPDMQWCHVVPLRSYGRFPARNTARGERPIWKLAPEGQVRELDVPASRCSLVKAQLVARTTNADAEVWDIPDSEPYAAPFEQPTANGSTTTGKSRSKAK